MDRRAVGALLGSLATTSAAVDAAGATAPPGVARQPFLRISGDIRAVNNVSTGSFDFTETGFLALPTTVIVTSTPWTPRSVFVGPLLVTVMRAAGVNTGTLTVRSLDDSAVSIPWSDLVRYGVILAHSQNGKRLNNRRWGPLWTIYPRDQLPGELTGPVAESRLIWQVNRIEVRS